MVFKDPLKLSIESLAFGGRGLGRHLGIATFVPLTAPGDKVLCKIVREHKNYLEATLIKVIEPSSCRRKAPCPLFGECGGCQWQHLSYPCQVNSKELIFRDHLVRHQLVDPQRIKPIVASPHEWNYRNRAQFKCRQTEKGFVIGFYRSGSHYVIDVESCFLLHPKIQEVFCELRSDLPNSPAPKAIPQVDVSCGDDGITHLIFHVLPSAATAVRLWLKQRAVARNWNVSLQVGRKESLQNIHGLTSQTIILEQQALELTISPGGFAQVNSHQNKMLVSAVIECANLTGEERVIDLFCGGGNFSLPLALQSEKVIGVESYAPAIDDARSNAKTNQVVNVDFHVGDAAKTLKQLIKTEEFDLLVLDPPRSGCYDIARLIKDCYRPPKIVYISCNPATLVRDLTLLIHNGYQVVSSQAFDFFPQTWHIESVTCLERQG